MPGNEINQRRRESESNQSGQQANTPFHQAENTKLGSAQHSRNVDLKWQANYKGKEVSGQEEKGLSTQLARCFFGFGQFVIGFRADMSIQKWVTFRGMYNRPLYEISSMASRCHCGATRSQFSFFASNAPLFPISTRL